jgi:hypothetical protein
MPADEPSDSWQLLRPDPIGGPTPPELSTGNPEDDQVLRQLAARTSLSLPRSWRHFLCLRTEADVGVVARPLVATGWQVSALPPSDEDTSWYLVAEMHDVVLTGEMVSTVRHMFEAITEQLAGAEYDGWEASIEPGEQPDDG